MEVCGGHTHAIYRHGLKNLLPREHRAGSRPGLSGLRVADGPHRRRPGDRRAARRDHDRLRRHDARPRHAGHAARAQGPRRWTSAWCIRRWMRCGSRRTRPKSTSFSSRSASRRPRRRPRSRSHARKALGIRNFSVFCNHVTIVPAIRAILDSPDMRLDALRRAGPRVDRNRLPAVRVHRARLRQAGRHLGLRAARHPRSRS